jgi:predicted nucleic acid-binding protein
MTGYLFDTNIFNCIINGSIDSKKLINRFFYATLIQLDEIRATSNIERRSRLEDVFTQIIKEQIPTESFVIGVSRINQAKVSDGSKYYQLMQRLNELNKGKENNLQDVLIAETALANNLTLVTHDRDLSQVIIEFGGSTCRLADII